MSARKLCGSVGTRCAKDSSKSYTLAPYKGFAPDSRGLLPFHHQRLLTKQIMRTEATNKFEIHFDGGYGSNGYGSWEVSFNGFSKRSEREQYGDWKSGMTCNVAEYTALVNALSWLKSVKHPERYTVYIWSDSMLVVNQVRGQWKVKKEHLRKLRDRVRDLLCGYREFEIHWHGRLNNVRRFGH